MGTEPHTHIAVASNFAPAMKHLIQAFYKDSAITITAAYGSSGKLYAQIINGAPYSMFFSADEDKPQRLASHLAINDKFVKTYAVGRLAFWSRTPLSSDVYTLLSQPSLKRIAIANPRLAPYGAAAIESIHKLELYDSVKTKLILGENVSQALQFAMTGAVDMALVSLPQAIALQRSNNGYHLEVKQSLHTPIKQSVILLAPEQTDPHAVQFFNYVQRPESIKLIREFGYLSR